MDAETGFLIDGKIYPVPTLDSLSTDEIQVMYDYSGLILEDFVKPLDETAEEEEKRERRLRNPGLDRAMMHIAYQRGNRDVKPAKVKALISSALYFDAMAPLGGDDGEENEDRPPGSTTEPDAPSPNDSVTSKESSGPPSTNGSDRQDSPLTPTGTGRSDTSFPASHRTTSAV